MPEQRTKDTLDLAASIWKGLSQVTSAIGMNQLTPQRESSNHMPAATEPSGDLPDANEHVNVSKSKSAAPRPKYKRTGSIQERQATTRRTRNGAVNTISNPAKLNSQESSAVTAKTTNDLAGGSSAHELLQDVPRGTKRKRDKVAEDDQVMRSPEVSNRGAPTVTGVLDTAVEASQFARSEMTLDPRPRRSRRGVRSDIPVSSPVHITEAAQQAPSPSRHFGSESSPKAPMSGPRGPNRRRNGRKLGRPNGLRGAIKKAPNSGGEGIFSVESDNGLEQCRKLPAVGAKAPKKQKMDRNSARATSPILREEAAPDGTLEVPVPRKRGRPRKSTGAIRPQSGTTASSTRARRSARNLPDEPATAGSKGLRTSKMSQDAVKEANVAEAIVPASLGQDAVKEANVAEAIVPALLGQESSWDKILDAVRKNYPDPKQGFIGVKKAMHSTTTIQKLSKYAKKARCQYTQSVEEKSDELTQKETEEELKQGLSKIEEQIKNIKEHDVSEDGKKTARLKGCETISDIYLRGVPDMIYMLRAAIDYYFQRKNDGYDVASINEVIKIQDMTLHLCRTAAQWKQKPKIQDNGRLVIQTNIVKQIKSVAYPLLRDRVRIAFANEMQRLMVAERKEENLAKQQTRRLQLAHSSPTQADLGIERKAKELRRIAHHIKQSQEEHFAKGLGLTFQSGERRSASFQPHYSSVPPASQDTSWSRAEEKELLVQLQNRETCYLPRESKRSDVPTFWLTISLAAQRYLSILHTPLLQNKLPDHIREKALEYKPILMETLEEADYIRSIA